MVAKKEIPKGGEAEKQSLITQLLGGNTWCGFGPARCVTCIPVSTLSNQWKDHSVEQGLKTHLRLVGVRSPGAPVDLFVALPC